MNRSLFYAPKLIKIGGRITKLQSVRKWHVFYESQQNAAHLNILVSRGSVTTYFRRGGQCYKLICWKFIRLSSSERFDEIIVTKGWRVLQRK